MGAVHSSTGSSDIDALPEFSLCARGPAGKAFIGRGLRTYRSAALHVHCLPYGRPTAGSGGLAVLLCGRGTCSGKHALLAELAAEHEVTVELWLGIYLMSGGNTPGVGEVLRAHGLDAIPEAHCYLRWGKTVVDLTHPGAPTSPFPCIHHEERIRPDQAGEYKRSVHREHLSRWAALRGLTLDDAWQIRQLCIRALGT